MNDVSDSDSSDSEYFYLYGGGDSDDLTEYSSDVSRTQLQKAVFAGDIETVRSLIPRNDCPVDEVTQQEKRTALTMACFAGWTDCAEALIEAGASVNGRNSNGVGWMGLSERYHPLAVAASNGHRDCLELLLQAGVPTNIVFGGATTLLDCCRIGSAPCVRTLVSYGADINFQEFTHDVSCVQRCCTYGNTQCLDILLRAGASTELKDGDGDRPIQQAVYSKKLDCVKLLVAHGTNLYERNDQGKMPIDLVRDNAEIRDILQWAMANPMTLKQQCRSVIRTMLGPERLKNIADFPIPEALRLYLNFGMNDL